MEYENICSKINFENKINGTNELKLNFINKNLITFISTPGLHQNFFIPLFHFESFLNKNKFLLTIKERETLFEFEPFNNFNGFSSKILILPKTNLILNFQNKFKFNYLFKIKNFNSITLNLLEKEIKSNFGFHFNFKKFKTNLNFQPIFNFNDESKGIVYSFLTFSISKFNFGFKFQESFSNINSKDIEFNSSLNLKNLNFSLNYNFYNSNYKLSLLNKFKNISNLFIYQKNKTISYLNEFSIKFNKSRLTIIGDNCKKGKISLINKFSKKFNFEITISRDFQYTHPMKFGVFLNFK